MYKFKGTLFVQRVVGRKGPFNVAVLKTAVGDFKINDQRLDQFDEGALEGEFIVTQIFQKSRTWRNSIFTDLMCSVAPDGFLLSEESKNELEAAPPLDDEDAGDVGATAAVGVKSIDTPVTSAPAPLKLESVSKPESQNKTQDFPVYVSGIVESPQGSVLQDTYVANVQELFGTALAPLVLSKQEVIKLDPTVGRDNLRAQVDVLKQLGYKWQFKTQEWALVVTPSATTPLAN